MLDMDNRKTLKTPLLNYDMFITKDLKFLAIHINIHTTEF